MRLHCLLEIGGNTIIKWRTHKFQNTRAWAKLRPVWNGFYHKNTRLRAPADILCHCDRCCSVISGHTPSCFCTSAVPASVDGNRLGLGISLATQPRNIWHHFKWRWAALGPARRAARSLHRIATCKRRLLSRAVWLDYVGEGGTSCCLRCFVNRPSSSVGAPAPALPTPHIYRARICGGVPSVINSLDSQLITGDMCPPKAFPRG